MSIKGKLLRLEQPSQAKEKLVAAAVLSSGKLVRLEQDCQALKKLITLDVSIKGKVVRLVQFCQDRDKFVKPVVLICLSISLKLFAPYQALDKSVPNPLVDVFTHPSGVLLIFTN